MECVAQGAAIQAGVLSGEVKDVLLLDVTPLTLGIETLGGIRTPLIQRNTTIPTKKTQIFSTAADNQPSVEINVLQGEREMAADNKSLGRFLLNGIPPAPRGIPQIEVAFDIDANGILDVSAKDLGTGKKQSVKIAASQKLNEKEVERMKDEAEKFADEDKKRKESIEMRNNAETVIYSTEKMLQEYGDKVESETKNKIEEAVKDLKNAVEKNDTDLIKKELERVNKVAQEIGMKMYQEAMNQQQQETEKKEKSDDDTVVEGKYEDLDKKENEKKK